MILKRKGGWAVNTTQLECFMEVANFLNFSRAAERLQITQPAVSHQISSLEDELGTKLFFRTSKSVRLTQAGHLFTQYANEILKLSGLSRACLLYTSAPPLWKRSRTWWSTRSWPTGRTRLPRIM